MRIFATFAALLALVGGTATALAVPTAATRPAFDQAIAATKAAMLADPAKARQTAERALGLARALLDSRDARIAVATAEWLDGEALMRLNEGIRAAPLIADGLALAERFAPGTKLFGDLLRSRGALAANDGRVHEALLAYQRAYAVFAAAHEARSEALALEDIAHIYSQAGDYERALRYYSQAVETYDKDPAFLVVDINNRAEVFRKLGRSAEAERDYGAALVQARKLGGAMLEARILTNLAQVQTQEHKLAAAAATVAHANRLTSAPDAASWRPFLLGVEAQLAAAQGDDRSAATFLGQTFAGLDLSQTDMNFIESHKLASGIYERMGDQKLALAHLKAYERLDSEARQLIASTSSQLLSARFDFANQNLKISQLKQGQLQRDIELERQRGHFRIVVLAGALGAGGIVLVLLLIGYFSIRRSRDQVRDANVTLTSVNTKLEKALAAKTEFLATTSHEIRTPLNGILGMTQVLLARPGMDRDMREKVEVVHGAGETMRALIDDILDAAKMETGEISVAHEPVRLRSLLVDTARLWSGSAEAKGLKLALELGDAPTAILCDDARLRQIVSNLLSNAVKFTEHGVVTLAVRVEEGRESESLVIAVADSGIGISQDQHEAIFEPFHQVDGAMTRRFSGTGLGLAICKRLTAALGGTITVVSEIGEGSTFTLRLALERVVDEPMATPITAEAPASLAAASLLLVEANPLTQAILRSMLQPHVGAVQIVANGDAALAALAAGGVHHVLIEAGSAAMAAHDPVAAVRTLVSAATTTGALTTLLVASAGPIPLAELIVVGASQTVMKPIAGTDLVAALRSLYDQRDPAAAARTEAAAA